MAHVLIGFAEALPAAEVVFSLLHAGHRVSAFARTKSLPLARLPLEALHVVPAPEHDAKASADTLATLMHGDTAPDLVLPLDDAGLWLTNAAKIAPDRIAGAVGPAAEVALDKAAQVDAARASGLAVPDTVLAGGQAAIGTIAFPAIAKPAPAVQVTDNQLVKGDAHYLTGEADIGGLQGQLAKSDTPYLIQPLIAGQGEGAFGFATSDGVVAWSGHRRLRMMNPHGSGSSACEALEPDETTRQRVTDFLNHIGWRGPFMVELLRDADGTAWFMELNGRMWGSMALARRRGLEYPAWAVAMALDPTFRPEPPNRAGPTTVRHMGRELLHLLFVLRGPKTDMHRANWPRFSRSLAAVLKPARGESFYNYDPAHRFYFLKDTAWTLRKALKR
ncbi:MAG: hypothetical protein HKN02_04110 [Rhodobacteraceae bacterium]|nr:hypothetical protein [Paracoccaceae bacterium]